MTLCENVFLPKFVSRVNIQRRLEDVQKFIFWWVGVGYESDFSEFS